MAELSPGGPAREVLLMGEDLVTIDTVTPADAWQTGWRDRHAARLAESPWAARVAV